MQSFPEETCRGLLQPILASYSPHSDIQEHELVNLRLQLVDVVWHLKFRT